MEISKRNYLSNVSLVIPCAVADFELLKLLLSREHMDLFFQIIIVFSRVESGFEDFFHSHFLSKNKDLNISLICIDSGVLHPGQARNIGVDAVKTDYVTFLDVRTVPSPSWFESISSFVQLNCCDLQLGSVKYIPSSYLAEIFATSTFGFYPLQCLPGSILSVPTFRSIGCFISARSGEDSEWIYRLKLIGITTSECSSFPLLMYNLDVERGTLFALVRKWFRNYSVSFKLPGYQVHKYLYTILGSSIFLLFLSMWNWRIAGWDEDSPLYLPFITRVALIILATSYLAIRGFFMPISKGVFNRRHPYLLILFSFPLAILLDIVKTIAGFRAVFDKLLAQVRGNKI